MFFGKREEDCKSLGLTMFPDFISEAEEDVLLTQIRQTEIQDGSDRNSIQRFGSDKPYPKDVISATIPEYLQCIAKKIFTSGLLNRIPDSVSINEYFPGQGIPPHIDSAESGDVISILGLLSYTVVNFTRKQDAFKVLFPARCLMQMRNEIRDKWKHSIDSVIEDVMPPITLIRAKRISIVFRNSKTTD